MAISILIFKKLEAVKQLYHYEIKMEIICVKFRMVRKLTLIYACNVMSFLRDPSLLPCGTPGFPGTQSGKQC
jgi:hypothetical protein